MRRSVVILILALAIMATSCTAVSPSQADTEAPTESETLRLSPSNAEDIYAGYETGVPLEGSATALWKITGDTLYLCGEGGYYSMAMTFYPWKLARFEHVTEVQILEGVTSIGSYAFYNCENIERIKVVDNSLYDVGMGCFGDMDSLRSVTLGNRMTRIVDEAFIRCRGLTEIHIPATVTTIGYGAFDACDSLTHVYYAGTPEEWASITIEGGNDALMRAEIVFGTTAPETETAIDTSPAS